jgi:hypothetical protein
MPARSTPTECQPLILAGLSPGPLALAGVYMPPRTTRPTPTGARP